MNTPDKTEISEWFQSLQDEICHVLEKGDGKGQFREDQWERPGGGGGRSRVIAGQHIEKGGVNFSAVHGAMSEKAGQSLGIGACDFYATGVSIVLHPKNPWTPIIHMNVRYFETNQGQWWFGGGIDLTPHYILAEDARFFHQSLKAVCDDFHPQYYPDFKKWADDYFFIPHRNETRGVGGIFFDRLDEKQPLSKRKLFEFVKAVGQTFAPTYLEILNRRKDQPFTPEHQDWQHLRRGRYVEFNLVWDRGTKFGLQTGGRIESILMSMPPLAEWAYNHQPAPESDAFRTLSQLKKGINWLA